MIVLLLLWLSLLIWSFWSIIFRSLNIPSLCISCSLLVSLCFRLCLEKCLSSCILLLKLLLILNLPQSSSFLKLKISLSNDLLLLSELFLLLKLILFLPFLEFLIVNLLLLSFEIVLLQLLKPFLFFSFLFLSFNSCNLLCWSLWRNVCRLLLCLILLLWWNMLRGYWLWLDDRLLRLWHLRLLLCYRSLCRNWFWLLGSLLSLIMKIRRLWRI